LKKIYFLSALLVTFVFPNFFNSIAYSQSIKPDSIAYRYWIYFKDKGKYKHDEKLEQGSEGYLLAKSTISDKAFKRRKKVLSENELIRYQDLPVYIEYIQAINNLGIQTISVSKWLNAVSVIAVKSELEKIKSLGIVEKIEGVHFLEKVKSFTSGEKRNIFQKLDSLNKYNYGESFWQNEQIKVPLLHNIGITGFGITVGMCDDGFNWRNHQALRTRKVVAEYDWSYKDEFTFNQVSPDQYPSDNWDQDGHGTETMSSLGGFYEGRLIGPAFDVDFYLSKTEVDGSETPVEEDYWLEAIEWMESQGVEVVSSSLIYKPFDDPNNKYTYQDMNGNTTIIARASKMAVYLGVVVCNSMGNEWQTEPPSIVSPPDADSVIAVGAVDSAGIITYFSSNGPTSDNRIKPDVVAMGEYVWTAMSKTASTDDSTYSHVSGTSFSCPITAGVCALILSAHPELTPLQVREALRNTADRSSKPDNVYGWGLINAYSAALYYGLFFSNKPEIEITNNSIKISTHLISKNLIDEESVQLNLSQNGTDKFKNYKLTMTDRLDDNNSGKYFIEIPKEKDFDFLKMYFTASDKEKNITSPYSAPKSLLIYHPDNKQFEIIDIN
jgi:serine protease AprX